MGWFRRSQPVTHLEITWLHDSKTLWSNATFHLSQMEEAKSIARDFEADPHCWFVHLYCVEDGVRVKEIEFR